MIVIAGASLRQRVRARGKVSVLATALHASDSTVCVLSAHMMLRRRKHASYNVHMRATAYMSEQPSNDDKQSVTARYSEWSTPLQRSFSPWVTLDSRVEQEKLQHTQDTEGHSTQWCTSSRGRQCDDKEGTGHNSMSPRACLSRFFVLLQLVQLE